MTSSSRALTLDLDQLDELVRDISLDVLAGSRADREARMEIYGAVFRTGLVEHATREWCRSHAVGVHLHDEMVEVAEDFFRDKILDIPADGDQDDPERRVYFDLAKFAAGASAAGAIRQFARSHMLMSQTLLRKVTRQKNRLIQSSDLLDHNLDADSELRPFLSLVPSAPDNATAGLGPAGSEIHGELVSTEYERRVAGKRGVARTEIDASTIREMYALPELERPMNPGVRKQLADWLDEDHERAMRSVEVLLGLCEGDSKDLAVAQIWSTFGSADLELLTETNYSRRVAHLLARDAVADRPWPGKPAAARARSEVKRVLAGTQVGAAWSAELVDTYLANEHETRSAWDPDADSAPAAPALNPARYQALLRQAANLTGHPLGATDEKVREALAAHVRAAKDSTARRKATRSTARTAPAAATPEGIAA